MYFLTPQASLALVAVLNPKTPITRKIFYFRVVLNFCLLCLKINYYHHHKVLPVAAASPSVPVDVAAVLSPVASAKAGD